MDPEIRRRAIRAIMHAHSTTEYCAEHSLNAIEARGLLIVDAADYKHAVALLRTALVALGVRDAREPGVAASPPSPPKET